MILMRIEMKLEGAGERMVSLILTKNPKTEAALVADGR